MEQDNLKNIPTQSTSDEDPETKELPESQPEQPNLDNREISIGQIEGAISASVIGPHMMNISDDTRLVPCFEKGELKKGRESFLADLSEKDSFLLENSVLSKPNDLVEIIEGKENNNKQEMKVEILTGKPENFMTKKLQNIEKETLTQFGNKKLGEDTTLHLSKLEREKISQKKRNFSQIEENSEESQPIKKLKLEIPEQHLDELLKSTPKKMGRIESEKLISIQNNAYQSEAKTFIKSKNCEMGSFMTDAVVHKSKIEKEREEVRKNNERSPLQNISNSNIVNSSQSQSSNNSDLPLEIGKKRNNADKSNDSNSSEPDSKKKKYDTGFGDSKFMSDAVIKKSRLTLEREHQRKEEDKRIFQKLVEENKSKGKVFKFDILSEYDENNPEMKQVMDEFRKAHPERKIAKTLAKPVYQIPKIIPKQDYSKIPSKIGIKSQLPTLQNSSIIKKEEVTANERDPPKKFVLKSFQSKIPQLGKSISIYKSQIHSMKSKIGSFESKIPRILKK